MLPAHFLRVIRRYFIRRSFHVDRFFRAFVGRSCGSLSGVRGRAGIIHVGRSLGHTFRGSRSFVHSLGHFVRVLRVRWVILCSAFRAGVIFRWLFVGVFALL